MADPLRCLYVDLDNTLLGARASLLHDGDGAVTLLGARALEACHRAEIEVVIMSGRRQMSVREDARVFGSRAYIFEAGSCWVDGTDEHWLTAPFLPGEQTIHEQLEATGAPRLLLDHYAGNLEYHDPWHIPREVSHLFRGHIDAMEATALLHEHGHTDLRVIDNGGVGGPGTKPGQHGYHLIPEGVSKGRAVAAHMQARGYAPSECIACGDSREDITAAEAVGSFWLVANGLTRDPDLREALPRNARVTEAGNGPGVYEAVVTELAERRSR
jgi:hydroxymethylpyrimidine pyrophosphatase-like HAD family hydrolase